MLKPSYEEIQSYAGRGEYQVCPLMKEILSDFTNPILSLQRLKKASPQVFLLESVEGHEKWGRYTFLGFEPKECLSLSNGVLHMEESGEMIETKEPWNYIRDLLKKYHSPRLPGFPSFTGGLMGYFSYDYLKYQEPTLRLDAEDTEAFQDLDLMLFDKLIVFDNLKQKILLIANVRLHVGKAGYERATAEIERMESLLRESEGEKDIPGRLKSPLKAYFSKEKYVAMVEKAKQHIHEGDIFQIVLSNRLEAEYEGTLLNAYRSLRTLNPSPYMFYLSSPDLELAGASPETLVKLEDKVLHTFPLAGTRPRGATKEEDERLEQELLEDEKELSEHNMLVDLGRNDIGKISKFGTVALESFHEVIRYSHVMHIGSTVHGEIRADKDALDAVGAILPAGTLSGAPKLRACQLINDLENCKRGIYGGGIGYLDFSGNLDLCIAIRIAYKKNGKVFIRSGAGIVADSVAEKEYEECIHKAKAVVTALEEAEKLG